MSALQNYGEPIVDICNVLREILFAGTFETTHRDLRDILLDPIFDPQPGLTQAEAGRLSYARSRVVHSRIEPPKQILQNPLRLFALAEWPSLGDVSAFSIIMVHYNLTLGTMLDHGCGRDDIADEVDALDRMDAFGPYMATELGYGNNVAALGTEAVYDAARQVFILRTPDTLSQKYMSYSGFPEIPKVAVVLARLKSAGTDWGVFPFLVRLNDENGLRAGIRAAPCPEKPVQGLDNGLTFFDGLELPKSSLLSGDIGELADDGTFTPRIGNSRRRFLRAMSRIVPGRLCVASAAVGAGRASVFIAARYALNRLTNAPGSKEVPILAYRTHHVQLLGALAKAWAMTMLVNRCKRALLEAGGEASPGLNTLVSVTKSLATWEMTDVVATCRERCGAQGIFSANRINDYVSLLQGLVTAEGDNLVLISTAAAQIVAGTPDNSDPHPPAQIDLDCPERLLDLLQFRVSRMRLDLRRSRENAPHEDYFSAWNDISNSAVAMARTFGASEALAELNHAAKSSDVDKARDLLTALARLYGLREIQQDAGWYIAQGALTPKQFTALEDRINTQCSALMPGLGALTDAFGLTHEHLRAPIAHADYASAFTAASDPAYASALRTRLSGPSLTASQAR